MSRGSAADAPRFHKSLRNANINYRNGWFFVTWQTAHNKSIFGAIVGDRCDIAPFMHKGGNEIRVEVTATWFNRLVYDFGQPPEKRKTWTIWDIPRHTPPCLKPGAALRDSGLLGPVTLRGVKSGRD